MMVYLLARKWRGVINIASMRIFENYDRLYHHIQEHPPEHWSGPEPYHIYEVYDDGKEARPFTLKQNRAIGLRPPKGKPVSGS
jgi:hypothetical protein